jgi:hypothetical protein
MHVENAASWEMLMDAGDDTGRVEVSARVRGRRAVE